MNPIDTLNAQLSSLSSLADMMRAKGIVTVKIDEFGVQMTLGPAPAPPSDEFDSGFRDDDGNPILTFKDIAESDKA